MNFLAFNISKVISYPQAFCHWLVAKNQPVLETPDEHPHRPTTLFLSSIILYCIYLLLMQPEWVLSGEMFAEMGNNHFVNANMPSITQILFATEAGYIPLPQRIMAYVGTLLKLPASSIPYFYTWSAIILTGILAGIFCLRPFRILVKNDLLRFFSGMAILMVIDYETRTFLSATYFAAFFGAVITALALVDKENDSPWWAWFIPILVMGKPAVLSILPAMILVSTVSKIRFKLITCVAIIFGLAQLIQMIVSHNNGAWVGPKIFSIFDKSYTTIEFFIRCLGTFSVGNLYPQATNYLIWLGLVFLVLSIFILFTKRNSSSAMIFLGLNLVFFNAIIICFGLNSNWNIDSITRFTRMSMYRHLIVGFFGVVMVVVGFISAIFDEKFSDSSWLANNLGPLFFLVWFFSSGWFSFSGSLKIPNFPFVGTSQWKNMANAIDSGEPVCVPIDPLGWLFSRNCQLLSSNVRWGKTIYQFESISKGGSNSTVLLSLPSSMMQYKNLLSLAVMVQPHTMQTILVNAKARVEMKNGTSKYLIASRQIAYSGGLLMFTTKGSIPISDIQSVTLNFDIPVDLGFVTNEPGNQPAVMWMGN